MRGIEVEKQEEQEMSGGLQLSHACQVGSQPDRQSSPAAD